MNGDTALSYTTPIVNRKFYSTGYDAVNGEIILKVVNASDRPCYSKINLSGNTIEPTGRVITLKAGSKQEENTFEHPQTIYPQERSFNKFGNTFKYTFEPNSLTIFRIKTV